MSTTKKKPKSANTPKTKKQAPKAFWTTYWLPGLILLLLPFGLYFSSLNFGYVLDDVIVNSENSFVKKGFAGLTEIFGNDSFTGYLGTQQELVAGARYRPLSLATFAVEHALYGLNPGLNHFFNILFYALTGLLIFRVSHLLFPVKKKSTTWYLSFPFLVAGLFLLHPIHTEVVANIKGRDEILVLLLSLGTLYYTIRYTKQKNLLYLFAAGLTFWLALLAKENAITFLAIIPAALYFFKKATLKDWLPTLIPLLAAFGLYLVMRIAAVGQLYNPDFQATGIMNDPFINTTFVEKYATIIYTLGQYLKLLIFPHPLTHDYYPYQVPILTFADYRVWIALLANGALVFWMFRSWKRGSIPAWSILFYFATLSIVSNVVFSVGAPMNERFVYMSSLGFIALLVWVLIKWLPTQTAIKDFAPIIGLGVLSLCTIGYAGKTLTRVPAWKDAMSLNRSAIKVSTNSARIHQYMAYSLYRQGLEQAGAEQLASFNEAWPLVNRALEIYPDYFDALKCKSGLIAGFYQQDRDLDKLLNGFYEVLQIRHLDFVDQYMDYLIPREDGAKLANFCYRAGYELMAQQQGNIPLAIKYLDYGLQASPGNTQLLQARTLLTQ